MLARVGMCIKLFLLILFDDAILPCPRSYGGGGNMVQWYYSRFVIAPSLYKAPCYVTRPRIALQVQKVVIKFFSDAIS